MESLRFFNSAYSSPTNAAVLLFGKDPRRFFPGAYVQYVSFDGTNNAAPILNEHPFTGPVLKVLSQIDLFIETTVARKRPVPVTALREKTVFDYPKAAIRELMLNAIMHRDYQGNAPIKFYQYADRLEVVNHGGLYGRARPENFPNVSDYRNPVIAEAMKVLGYVNCYNRGIEMVQEELQANGNGKAEFSFRLVTAFEAKVNLASDSGRSKSDVAKSGADDAMRTGTDRNKKSDKKRGKKSDKKIIGFLKARPTATIADMRLLTGLSSGGIQKLLQRLKATGVLRRVGPDKGGHWEVGDFGE